MEIKPIEITKWDDYKQLISTIIASENDYYYRGQMNDQWRLQTSFHRLSNMGAIKLKDYYSNYIPELHYLISAYHNERFDLDNPLELSSFLSLVQHHGFPTPLLDWTTSPYIAVFFAFREINTNSPQNDHIKIFMFDYQSWERDTKQPSDFKNETNNHITIIKPFVKYNPRIIPQKGTFTITNVDDMESHINTISATNMKNYLNTIILSTTERLNIMRELDLMGINEMTLFPGIDGICKTSKEYFFTQKLQSLKLPSKVNVPPEVIKRWRKVALKIVDHKNNEENDITIDINSFFEIDSNLKVIVSDFLPDFRVIEDIVTSASNELKNPAVFIKVSENDINIFSYWLYAKFPSIHPFMHERYGITLIDAEE